MALAHPEQLKMNDHECRNWQGEMRCADNERSLAVANWFLEKVISQTAQRGKCRPASNKGQARANAQRSERRIQHLRRQR